MGLSKSFYSWEGLPTREIEIDYYQRLTTAIHNLGEGNPGRERQARKQLIKDLPEDVFAGLFLEGILFFQYLIFCCINVVIGGYTDV